MGPTVPALLFPAVSLLIVAALACFVASLGLSVHEINRSIEAIEVEFRRARVPDR
jgi:hypothetical protein